MCVRHSARLKHRRDRIKDVPSALQVIWDGDLDQHVVGAMAGRFGDAEA